MGGCSSNSYYQRLTLSNETTKTIQRRRGLQIHRKKEQLYGHDDQMQTYRNHEEPPKLWRLSIWWSLISSLYETPLWYNESIDWRRVRWYDKRWAKPWLRIERLNRPMGKVRLLSCSTLWWIALWSNWSQAT